MAPATERTSLLSRISKANSHTPTEATSSDNAIVEEDDMETQDEPVDVLMSRYGSPAGSLGLSGGFSVFGSPITRRGSAAFEPAGLGRVLSRTGQPRKQPSIFKAIPGAPPTVAVESPTSLPSEMLTTNADIGSDVPIQSIDETTVTKKPPKFLYGISEAGFWACFTGILLTWFVRRVQHNLLHPRNLIIIGCYL